MGAWSARPDRCCALGTLSSQRRFRGRARQPIFVLCISWIGAGYAGYGSHASRAFDSTRRTASADYGSYGTGNLGYSGPGCHAAAQGWAACASLMSLGSALSRICCDCGEVRRRSRSAARVLDDCRWGLLVHGVEPVLMGSPFHDRAPAGVSSAERQAPRLRPPACTIRDLLKTHSILRTERDR